MSLGLGSFLADFLGQVGDKFLDGVSVDSEFYWVGSLGSISVLKVVTIEEEVGKAGVFAAEPLVVMEISSLEMLKVFSGKQVVGLGHSWSNWLGKAQNGLSLDLEFPVEWAELSFELGKALERSVDEGVDFLGSTEPG